MQPSEFHGIASLDQELVDQLRKYLDEKEGKLSQHIVNAIHPLPGHRVPMTFPSGRMGYAKLAEAVEAFSKNLHKIASSSVLAVPSDDWEVSARQINAALWEYVEVLEGCVTELFLQLGQASFEQWSAELMHVIDSLKDDLVHRLEEVLWKTPRLEALLWEYRSVCKGTHGEISLLQKLRQYWLPLLDLSLVSYANKSKKLLFLRFKMFAKRFGEYQNLKNRADQSLRKFKGYSVFQSLPDSTMEGIKRLYWLIKVWELNKTSKSIPKKEVILSIRSAYAPEKSLEIFREYYEALFKTLFERSRKLKDDPKELYSDIASRHVIGKVLSGYRAEVHTLGATAGRYRDFLLDTHPNPYVRARFGFVEWIVGPEPSRIKKLLNVLYDTERLDRLFEQLEASLEKGPAPSDSSVIDARHREITKVLHEMGQPLASRQVMRAKAEKLLQLVKQSDELGAFYSEVVDHVAHAFGRALRLDVQYYVLFDFPLFHHLFALHQGIAGLSQDRQHLNRVNKFKALILRIEEWVRHRNVHRHIQEIGSDLSDVKGYLQDFLGSVQRIAKERGAGKSVVDVFVQDVEKQILQYRYVFGNFQHFLQGYESEEKLLRSHFLFIDPYFESVEKLLQEMREQA